MTNIQMVDLKGQYQQIKAEIDQSIEKCIADATFINGPQVGEFAANLERYLNVKHVIPCANGTDALQIAFMALGLQQGDEVIVPSFTYVATAEVLGLLNLTPVMVDVDPCTFNITAEIIEKATSGKTKAIVPVHLFGQCVNMEPILKVAKKYNLFIVEDTAQAIGADYTFNSGKVMKAGTIGHIGCTSFFPSKNLGCYGDGGAIYTNDTVLAEKIKMIANHGQKKKYVHSCIGVNSRLDSVQAAILNVKLQYLDKFSSARERAASYYDNELFKVQGVKIPVRANNSSHVFHQYTLKIKDGKRNALQLFLQEKGIPSMIYYPIPLNEQDAFKGIGQVNGDLSVTKDLCSSVLSLPIHTEMKKEQQDFIIQSIKDFFN